MRERNIPSKLQTIARAPKKPEEARRFASQLRPRSNWMCAGVLMSAAMMVSAMSLAPIAEAANSGDEPPATNYLFVDHAALENLQRWVAAGHEDWCKDPRLVAAGGFQRLAPDFAGEAMELQTSDTANGDASNDSADKMTFAWAPLDGRAIYRVTVERFNWLLPIAKSPDALIWVPTVLQVVQPARATRQLQTDSARPDSPAEKVKNASSRNYRNKLGLTRTQCGPGQNRFSSAANSEQGAAARKNGPGGPRRLQG